MDKALLLCFCCVVAVFLLCFCCVLAVFLLCSCCVFVMFLLCFCCVFAVFVLCCCCVFAVFLLCFCCVFAVFLAAPGAVVACAALVAGAGQNRLERQRRGAESGKRAKTNVGTRLNSGAWVHSMTGLRRLA